MASITAWAKKVWKDRKTEYPTRRTLTKTDGSQEIVTVERKEGNISQEGDAFSAANMNDLEERIDAGFTEVTRKLGENTITKISITDESYSSGVLVVTDKIPQGMHAFGFIITGGTPAAHTAQVWENLVNGSINVTFKLWSNNAVSTEGTVSGILLCL